MGTFNDISATFEIDAQGSLKIVEDGDAIRQSIKNILLTLTGSRAGSKQEYYGTNLKKFTFAPLTRYSGGVLASEIVKVLTEYEPRIDIENVEVNVNYDDNRFDLGIYYKVKTSKGQVEQFRMVINQM